MDIHLLLRIKGLISARATDRPGQAEAESYPRVRAELANALSPDLLGEFDRLFPPQLSTTGQVWGKQGTEAVALYTQMVGWVEGIVESAVFDARLAADARERGRTFGFSHVE